ncbi:NAD(+) diphosphatase [Nakamurella antarctica]|uniref:NAD(+) diphosphatase n=1 Tax=Nakamurella antarctica TaxID=1902245 RepID=A0A3G8ZNM0_9ACTN|nr:NAD(+) diphosphatase [Nakamurella antarctica]AZI58407.1 NAD(+) diphosphatase [Nakamurella antarctica]
MTSPYSPVGENAGDESLGEVGVSSLAAAALSAEASGWLRRPVEPVLSRGTADRGEDQRNPERIEHEWPRAKVLIVDSNGRVAADTDGTSVHLRYSDALEMAPTVPADAVLLGTVDGIDHWALPGEVEATDRAFDDGWGRTGGGLRQWGGILSDTESGLLTSATAVLTWHAMAQFCPRCGLPNRPSAAGWTRTCEQGHVEFPRTDPAVIMLVHDGADHCVLARQPSWPVDRYSILAGFTEAGESLEATVIREVGEEVGVAVSEVNYLGSQPWPFPRSLMVGFAAKAQIGAELTPRPGEIEKAQWVSRDRVREALAAGGGVEGLILPSAVSIARQLIDGWATG